MLPSVFYCSLFVAADKLQYQSLDAVNKEGMFVPATNFFYRMILQNNAYVNFRTILCVSFLFLP